MTSWLLDRPEPGRPHRVYVAVTNHCNRACPWCSTWSSPSGSSFLSRESFASVLPTERDYQLQLEGGEPTLHPSFWELVRAARGDSRCTRLIVSTNGTTLPRDGAALRAWVAALGEPLTLKVSFNHYLLEQEPLLADRLVEVLSALGSGGDRALVVNARFRPDVPGDEPWLSALLERRGLMRVANMIPLQRYGRAFRCSGWPVPTQPWSDFTLVNPDGAQFGADLLRRSAAMGAAEMAATSAAWMGRHPNAALLCVRRRSIAWIPRQARTAPMLRKATR